MSIQFIREKNTSAYLKMGLLGFQGTGKTKTATKTAIGLVSYLKARKAACASKPAFIYDTETGSDWIVPDFDAAGIAIECAKTRSFSDLIEFIRVAEQHGSVALIDSISHPWRELCESYCRRKAQILKRPTYRLQMNDWGYLKGDQAWGKFSDLFVNSSLHIILCGRAGYEFNMDEDDEGHKQLEKTGVKMKVEGEFGFEPSLLVYMDRLQEMKGHTVVRQWRTATVLKDRAGLIDGKVFENPGFADFLPHIERLNIGGHQVGFDATRTSIDMISAEPHDNRTVQRKIVLDEIESVIAYNVPGQAVADKKRKLELLRIHFNASWAEIEQVMPIERLRSGYDTLLFNLEGTHSKYWRPAADLGNGSGAATGGTTNPMAAVVTETVYGADCKPLSVASKEQGLPRVPNRAAGAPAPAPVASPAVAQPDPGAGAAGHDGLALPQDMVAHPVPPVSGAAAAKPAPERQSPRPSGAGNDRRGASSGADGDGRAVAAASTGTVPRDLVGDIDVTEWLAGVTRAFSSYADLDAFKAGLATLVKPQKGTVPDDAWARANAIARAAYDRIADVAMAA